MTAMMTALAGLKAGTVTMTTKIDPALIGGMVARIGSTVYDASVVRQLAELQSSGPAAVGDCFGGIAQQIQ